MVTITTTGSSVIFEFENCPTYLQNGTIEVPKNSLALTLDNSNMATFKKAASNDIFVSVSLDELDMDEEELMEVFAEMCSTGGSEEEIQELSGKVSTISGQVSSNTSDISTLSGQVASKADSSAVTEEIAAAVSGKADSSAVTEEITAVSNDVETLSGTVTSHTSNNDIHVTTQDKSYWDGKADASDIEAAVSGKADSSAVTEEITAAVSGKADTSSLTEHTSDSTIHVTSQDKTNWDAKADSSDITDAISGKADSSAVTEEITAAVSDKADTSALTSHTSDTTIHVTSEDKVTWNAKADASDLSTLSGTVTGLSSDVSTLSGTVTGISTDVSTLSGTVTGLSSDVSTLSGTVTGISSDVSTLSGTVTGLSSDVSTLSGTVTSHTADTTVHVTSTDKTAWDGAVTALGGVKLVKITQSAYDQLQTKDPDTLYIITAS